MAASATDKTRDNLVVVTILASYLMSALVSRDAVRWSNPRWSGSRNESI